MSRSLSPRAAAARLLAEVLDGQSLATLLPKGLERVDDNARALARELIYGSLREWPRLEALVQQRLQKPLKRKDNDIFALMVIGLHQLSAMRLPVHAAVSETVATARELKKPWATGLINGVLRSWQREHTAMESALRRSDADAMPGWLWQQIRREWPDQAEQIFLAARSHPPMTLRVNVSRTTRDNAVETLKQAGIDVKPSPTVPTAISLDTPMDVTAIPGFEQGLVSVQDESAQLAALLLAPQSGEAILDACAAPGGKTGHLLEMTQDLAVTAADISETRLARIQDNCRRLGFEPELICLDAANPQPTLSPSSFDAILADVPCSATGVIRRNPDIKLLRQPEDPESFAEQQRAILSGLWPLLREGGRLLYCTCSILRTENDAVVEWALTHLPGAELRTIEAPGAVATALGNQRLPHATGGDGLFFALIGRRGAGA